MFNVIMLGVMGIMFCLLGLLGLYISMHWRKKDSEGKLKTDWERFVVGVLMVIVSLILSFFSGQKWSKGEPSVEELERGKGYTVFAIVKNESNGYASAKNSALTLSLEDSIDQKMKYFVLSDECISKLFSENFPVMLFVNKKGACEWQKILVNGH